MSGANLSLDNTPPLSVPARYFLTAPLFAVSAAVLLLWFGPELLSSRWTPPALAATHLLTLGTISMVMIGALSQMIPVLAGSALRRPRLSAGVVHTALAGGALLLAMGLLGWYAWLPLAGGLLAVAVIFFCLNAGLALLRAPARNTSVAAMSLSLVALAVTVALGLWLAAARGGWGPSVLSLAWTGRHVAWGLFGWVGLLLVGVAYQVVPMFQITPRYPVVLQRGLVALIAAGLLGASVAGEAPGLQVFAEALLLTAGAVFALATLWLQGQRRRRVNDTTLRYWRFGMLCLLLAVALRASFLAGVADVPAGSVLLGLLALTGVIQPVINGMLYKIVPFLVWLHARRAGARRITMNRVIGDPPARRQYLLHVASVGLLCAALWLPELARPAAIVYGLANLYLFSQILHAMQFFRKLTAA